jgi:hypothetical protein
MHLIIANQIANQVSITDKNAFLLGGIAPDAVSPKELSHFFSGEVTDYSRSIDFNSFLEKYRSYYSTDYILGYYTHLIADDLWLKGFYLPWLKNRMEQDQDIFNRYHHDFRLLNGKLLDYYGITTNILENINNCDTIIDLQEVSAKDVNEFIPYLIQDMDYDQKDLDEDLQVFTLEQIIGYMETSIEKGIFHLKEFLEKKGEKFNEVKTN